MKIIINGLEADVSYPEDTVSYGDIVELTYGAKFREYVFSVTYSGPRHGDSRRSGIVAPGQTLKLEEGMIISCMDTGNA